MTLKEAIDMARAIRPAGEDETEIGDSVYTRWISELEGRIALLLRRAPAKAVKTLDPALAAVTYLSVPAPFDRIYWMYLVSMTDFAGGKAAPYAASKAMFAEAYAEYAKYIESVGAPER